MDTTKNNKSTHPEDLIPRCSCSDCDTIRCFTQKPYVLSGSSYSQTSLYFSNKTVHRISSTSDLSSAVKGDFVRSQKTPNVDSTKEPAKRTVSCSTTRREYGFPTCRNRAHYTNKVSSYTYEHQTVPEKPTEKAKKDKSKESIRCMNKMGQKESVPADLTKDSKKKQSSCDTKNNVDLKNPAYQASNISDQKLERDPTKGDTEPKVLIKNLTKDEFEALVNNTKQKKSTQDTGDSTIDNKSKVNFNLATNTKVRDVEDDYQKHGVDRYNENNDSDPKKMAPADLAQRNIKIDLCCVNKDVHRKMSAPENLINNDTCNEKLFFTTKSNTHQIKNTSTDSDKCKYKVTKENLENREDKGTKILMAEDKTKHFAKNNTFFCYDNKYDSRNKKSGRDDFKKSSIANMFNLCNAIQCNLDFKSPEFEKFVKDTFENVIDSKSKTTTANDCSNFCAGNSTKNKPQLVNNDSEKVLKDLNKTNHRNFQNNDEISKTDEETTNDADAIEDNFINTARTPAFSDYYHPYTDLNPRAAELSAQIMNMGYIHRSYDNIVSPHHLENITDRIVNKIGIFDIFKRILEAYKACSCMICKCVTNKPTTVKNVCDCKPCACNDCVNIMGKRAGTQLKQTYLAENICNCEPCPCQDCKRNKRAKPAWQIPPASCSNVKSNSINDACKCKTNDYYESKTASFPNYATVYPTLLGNSCACSPCECDGCKHSGMCPLTTNIRHEMSTEMTNYNNCICEHCGNIRTVSQNDCKCVILNKTIRKPAEKDTIEYDLRQAIVSNKAGSNKISDLDALFAIVSNTYPHAENNKSHTGSEYVHAFNWENDSQKDNEEKSLSYLKNVSVDY